MKHLLNKNRLPALLFYCFIFLSTVAQEQTPVPASPLNIPLYLSGNFGELRSNHFHSGIDFKTAQVVGKPVFAINDGYVSRIVINLYGFGKALYIDHPDGYTSVYGHLDSFSPAIENYAYRQQMEQQTYLIDIKVSQDSLPVKRGQEIALSGNTGNSAGPHLHFEIRETESENPIDPLIFYRSRIKDTRPPIVQSVALYPITGKGIIDSVGEKRVYLLASPSSDVYRIDTLIRAWGRIGIALKCHDLMDGTSNIYGVKNIRLLIDSTLIFNSNLSRFSFVESRYLNSLIDYGAWKRGEGFYQKCYLEPGNRLSFIEAFNRGVIAIDEEREYRITAELEDEYSNLSHLEISILGVPQDIVTEAPPCEEYFLWRDTNRFRKKGIDFEVPKGAIYESFCFDYSVDEEENPLAAVHFLHNEETPLHTWCRLSLRPKEDLHQNKTQYGIEKRTPKGSTWIGGIYKQGWVEGEIREFGVYTLGIDSLPPVITPVGTPGQWVAKKTIELHLTDNRSGIDNFKTYIDGKFVLFEINKKSIITTNLLRVPQTGKQRELTIEASDRCSNVSRYKEKFDW